MRLETTSPERLQRDRSRPLSCVCCVLPTQEASVPAAVLNTKNSGNLRDRRVYLAYNAS